MTGEAMFGGMTVMRTYLIVADESAEGQLALRFAARRAAGTDGQLLILGVIEPQGFVAWGGVQATIEAEAQETAEQRASAAADLAHAIAGTTARTVIRKGSPEEVVRALLMEEPGIAALVLGAAASGPPGPLVDHFAGYDAGALQVPLMIIPGAMSEEEIDKIS